MTENYRHLRSKVTDSSLGRWWQRTEVPNLVDWLLLGAILVFTYVIFLYGDVRATFEHSFNFLDSLFSGRIGDFYTISIENTSTGHPAVYDIPLYAIFALWNLPTYVIYRFTGFDYLNSTPAELWLKMMMVVFALLAAKALAGLARDLGVSAERSRWVSFFFLSSMSVVIPVFVIVQYDIILVLVMILGLRAYVRGDVKAFILWFILANTLKLFAVFLYIPLLLLREKRLRVVFGQLVLGFVGLVLVRLLYMGDVGYAAATSGFTDGMLNRLITMGIPYLGEGFGTDMSVPFFIVFIVGIAIGAYAITPRSDAHRNALAIYLGLAIYLVFSTIVPLNPYWIVLLAPFSTLIIFLNPRHLVLNILLEVSIASSILFLYTRIGYSMYNSDIFQQLLLPHLTPGAEYLRFASPDEFVTALGLGGGTPFIIGFLIACVLAVLILNYPRTYMVENLGACEERMPRSLVWFRLAAPAAFSAMILAIYFIPAIPTAYSSATDAPASTGNILSEGATVVESFTPESTISTSTISVGFYASGVVWLDSSVITFTVTDEAGTELLNQSVPANSIGDGMFPFPTDDLTLQAGETYEFTFTSSLLEDGFATIQVNPNVDLFPTTENRQTIPGDLVMTIEGSQE